MATLPGLRCPGCGKNIPAVTVHSVPPAVTYDDCLRRCPECKIGATNAKNPAKIKYIRADQPQDAKPPQP